jgi:hypothetical protein
MRRLIIIPLKRNSNAIQKAGIQQVDSRGKNLVYEGGKV